MRPLIAILMLTVWAASQPISARPATAPRVPGAAADSNADPAPSSRALAVRGVEVFRSNCARCHGVRGDGDSRVARVLQPPPSNLRASRLEMGDVRRMIELGGQRAFGRSATMPPWAGTLSSEEVEAVTRYVFGLRHADAF